MKKYILKEKGITLISLIITIIIILILAGISLNMIKGDSSILNQAISAQDKTIKGALKEKNDLNNLSSEATSKIQEALPGYKAPNSSVSDSEPVVPEIKHENTVQDGGIYYVGVTDTTPGNYSNPAETYAPGQDFPETPSNGDIYIYGDYEYRYNMVYTYTRRWEWYSTEINGWSVRVIDNTKSAYGPILSEINGKKIVSLCGTFANCKSLKTAPSIPNNITNLRYTFYECDSLTTAPNIPNNVEYLTYTFAGCDSLTTVKSIPNSVKEIYQAFFGCQMLTGTITIDSTPTYYWACFENTKKELYLTGSSTILKELAATDKYEDYSENDNVRVLKNIAPIPDGAIYYRGVTSENPGDYTGATQIYTAGQKFPDNVVDGDIYVYGDYEYRYNQQYTSTWKFQWWPNTSLNGWAVRVVDPTKSEYGPILQTINEKNVVSMSGTYCNCQSMVTSPNIPNYITNLDYTFTNCYALKGNLTIDATPSQYNHCFSGVKNRINLKGQSKLLKELAAIDGYTDFSPNDKVRVWTQIDPIPDGAKYYVGVTSNRVFDGATKIYQSGDEFPETTSTGDVYVCGDYQYRYNYYYTGREWRVDTSLNGWGVTVLDQFKKSYSDILTTINGAPITDMQFTFQGCISLTISPKLPNTVKNMTCAFQGCVSLTTPPVLPRTATNLNNTFETCSSLKTAPTIPENVTSMNSTFHGCTSLTTAPTISYKVNSLNFTFESCTSLTTPPRSTHGPSLGAKNMCGTFSGCTSLTTAPIISNSVQYLSNIFENCTALTGNVTINASPLLYTDCFKNVNFAAQHLTLSGSSTKLSELGATGINYSN